MKSEIKRNNWRRFFRKFNAANQHRQARLQLHKSGDNVDEITAEPFLGLALSKKGRRIDGIEVFTGQWNPDALKQPLISLGEPEKIWLEKDDQGRDNRLMVQSKDGARLQVELHGEKRPEYERQLVEKLAYSMYKNRGGFDGNDMGDWFEAESRVRDTEMNLTQL